MDVNMLISCVLGTRPEVVKMAPVIVRLRRDGLEDVRILSTGQHRSLLDQALSDFGLAADLDLDLMRPDQKLADLAGRALSAPLLTIRRSTPGSRSRPGRHEHRLLRGPGLSLQPHSVRTRRGRTKNWAAATSHFPKK